MRRNHWNISCILFGGRNCAEYHGAAFRRQMVNEWHLHSLLSKHSRFIRINMSRSPAGVWHYWTVTFSLQYAGKWRLAVYVKYFQRGLPVLLCHFFRV